jgi:hypothetical protein
VDDGPTWREVTLLLRLPVSVRLLKRPRIGAFGHGLGTQRMLASSVRPQAEGRDRMAGFLFRLETVEGEPANPPTLEAAVPNWGVGDRIYLGGRTLQVIGRRDDDADQPPVLVVENV